MNISFKLFKNNSQPYLFVNILFLITSLVVIFFGSMRTPYIDFANKILCFTGLIISFKLLKRGYVYLSTLLAFHVIMAFFAEWVNLNPGTILHEPIFNFTCFTAHNLNLAKNLLIYTYLTVYFCSLICAKKVYSNDKMYIDNNFLSSNISFEKLFIYYYFTLIIAVLGNLLILTNGTVLEYSYPLNLKHRWTPYTFIKIPFSISCITLFICYISTILGHSLVARKIHYARLLVIVSGFIYLLVIGARGYITFVWLIIALVEFSKLSSFKRSYFWGFIFLLLSYFCYDIWFGLRAIISYLSFAEALPLALNKSMLFGKNSFSGGAIEMTKLSGFPVIGQLLFHLLYVIQLVSEGISLSGQSFINLLPQFLPSQFDGVFGLERPLNDNFKLASYYSHGGGFLVVANAYWNGGVGVLLLFIFIVSMIFYKFDHKVFHEPSGYLYKYIYCLSFAPFFVQLGYGLQGLVRVIELLFIVLLLDKYMLYKKHTVNLS